MKIAQSRGTGISVTLKVLLASLLVFVGSVDAALIGIGSGAGLRDDSGGSAPEPIIDAAGRIGAEHFKDLSASFGDAGMEKLAARAQEVIHVQPNSGLAYEILGTVHYYQSEFDESEKYFIKAGQLEPAEPGIWVKLGIVQMELNKLASAEESLTTALKYQPGNRVANQRLGLLYEYNGETDKAITYLTRGMQGTRKDYIGIAVNLGNLLNSKNQYSQTVDLLKPRVKLDSKLPEAHTVLGAALLQSGESSAAVQRFARAIELVPENKSYRLGYVIALRKTGELVEALKAINSLISVAPDWAVAYLEKADILLAQNKLSEAKRVLDDALKNGASTESINRRLLAYHLENQNFDEAKRYLERIVKDGSGRPADFVRLSELTRTQGGMEASTEILEDGIAAFPNNGYLQFRYGSELAASRQYEKAEIALKKATNQMPGNLAILRAYSLAQAKNGNAKEAAETAEKIYKLKPEKPEALFLAIRLQANGQNNEAIEIYKEVLNEEKKNIVALNNLATAYSELGELNMAVKFAERANETLPDNAQLQDTLGWIFYKQKKYKEASTILEKAAAKATNNSKIQYHAGMAYKAVGDSANALVALERALDLEANAEWEKDARSALKELN